MRKANAAYVRKDAAKWKNAGWTSIPNGIIRDVDLPANEYWAWSWLASHDGEFEVSGKALWEANRHIGRNRAYELLSGLERRGYLLRRHVYDEQAGVPYLQYDLQPTPVPEDQRTWEPSKAKPRLRGPHPGSKAAQATQPVDNLVSAGQNGFPTGRESAGRERIPDRAGIRSGQDFPDRAGTGGVVPDRAGTGVPDRAGVHSYIQKNTLEEQKDTGGQLPLLGGGSSPPTPRASPNGSVSATHHLDALFDDFYASYPRKVGRKEARRKFETAVKAGTPARELIDGARRYAEAMAGTADRYVKHPATWLHQGCWTDEQPKAEAAASNGWTPYQDPDPAEYHQGWPTAATNETEVNYHEGWS